MSTEVNSTKTKSKFAKWWSKELPTQKYYTTLDGKHFISGFKLHYKDGTKFLKLDTKGMVARLETGATMDSWVSKGAVGAGLAVGALVFGPLGAIAGGLIGSTKRKGGGSVYIIIEREGQIIGSIEAPALKESEARKFIEVLNASANDPENS